MIFIWYAWSVYQYQNMEFKYYLNLKSKPYWIDSQHFMISITNLFTNTKTEVSIWSMR